MKRCMQMIMMIASGLILSNLDAAADSMKRVTINGSHMKMAVITGEEADFPDPLELFIPVSDDTEIGEIKVLISVLTNIDPHEQQLAKIQKVTNLFRDEDSIDVWQTLADHQTCKKYNIESGTVLKLSLIDKKVSHFYLSMDNWLLSQKK